MGEFAEFMREVDRLTDLKRQLQMLSLSIKTLREDTAMTGALPGEFDVVLTYRPMGEGGRLVPRLR